MEVRRYKTQNRVVMRVGATKARHTTFDNKTTKSVTTVYPLLLPPPIRQNAQQKQKQRSGVVVPTAASSTPRHDGSLPGLLDSKTDNGSPHGMRVFYGLRPTRTTHTNSRAGLRARKQQHSDKCLKKSWNIPRPGRGPILHCWDTLDAPAALSKRHTAGGRGMRTTALWCKIGRDEA